MKDRMEKLINNNYEFQREKIEVIRERKFREIKIENFIKLLKIMKSY